MEPSQPYEGNIIEVISIGAAKVYVSDAYMRPERKEQILKNLGRIAYRQEQRLRKEEDEMASNQ